MAHDSNNSSPLSDRPHGRRRAPVKKTLAGPGNSAQRRRKAHEPQIGPVPRPRPWYLDYPGGVHPKNKVGNTHVVAQKSAVPLRPPVYYLFQTPCKRSAEREAAAQKIGDASKIQHLPFLEVKFHDATEAPHENPWDVLASFPGCISSSQEADAILATLESTIAQSTHADFTKSHADLWRRTIRDLWQFLDPQDEHHLASHLPRAFLRHMIVTAITHPDHKIACLYLNTLKNMGDERHDFLLLYPVRLPAILAIHAQHMAKNGQWNRADEALSFLDILNTRFGEKTPYALCRVTVENIYALKRSNQVEMRHAQNEGNAQSLAHATQRQKILLALSASLQRHTGRDKQESDRLHAEYQVLLINGMAGLLNHALAENISVHSKGILARHRSPQSTPFAYTKPTREGEPDIQELLRILRRKDSLPSYQEENKENGPTRPARCRKGRRRCHKTAWDQNKAKRGARGE